MRRALWFLPAFLMGASAGLGFGVVHWRRAIDAVYPITRALYLHRQIMEAGPIDTLVIGDSISESTYLANFCGKTFNASVGGATVPIQLPLAKLGVARLKPSTVVIQTGRNYFHAGPNPQFEPDFRALLAAVRGRKLILVGIPLAPEETEFVRREAQRSGAKFVTPVTGSLTFDGVHPTPQGGLIYRHRLEEACANGLSPSRPS